MDNLPTTEEIIPLRPITSIDTTEVIPTRLTKSQLPLASEIRDTESLTKKQRRFITYYLEGYRPSKAAKLAGYSDTVCEHAVASILNSKAVRKELDRLANEQAERDEFKYEHLLERASRRAKANIADFIVVDPETGKFKFDLRGVSREQFDCVQDLYLDNNGNIRIQLTDKKGYDDLLAKIHKSRPMVEVSEDGEPVIALETLDAFVRGSVTVNQVNQVNNYIGSPERPKLSGTVIDSE